ncbi:hypothetical protein V2J09_004720 [Rumex salicifolius]
MPEGQTGELARRRGGFISVPAVAKLARRRPDRGGEGGKKLTKLLLNVNVQGSLGPVQVVMSPENTVQELIKAALDIYMRERRRPLLAHKDLSCFQLHYSQFSLESIKPGEKLINLGSRNFFLCRNPACSSSKCCSVDPLKKKANNSFPLIRLMDFLL